MSRQLEHRQQVYLFNWAKVISAQEKYRKIRRMFSIPNAAKRSPALGAYMKAEGLRAGVWDIFLPVIRSGYGGMFIEMKATTALTPAQKEFQASLGDEYHFFVAHDWIEASDAIMKYME